MWKILGRLVLLIGSWYRTKLELAKHNPRSPPAKALGVSEVETSEMKICHRHSVFRAECDAILLCRRVRFIREV